MTPTVNNTSLIQRIEIALASDNLHAAEVVGLIAAATAAEGKLQILINRLRLLLDALTAKESAAPAGLHVGEQIISFNEPDVPPRHRQQRGARS